MASIPNTLAWVHKKIVLSKSGTNKFLFYIYCAIICYMSFFLSCATWGNNMCIFAHFYNFWCVSRLGKKRERQKKHHSSTCTKILSGWCDMLNFFVGAFMLYRCCFLCRANCKISYIDGIRHPNKKATLKLWFGWRNFWFWLKWLDVLDFWRLLFLYSTWHFFPHRVMNF